MCADLESTRYLLLCSGLLLVFLGSRTGQIACLRVFNMLRSAYYLAIAILAACGALFFYWLGRLLLWLAMRIKTANSENPDAAPVSQSKILAQGAEKGSPRKAQE